MLRRFFLGAGLALASARARAWPVASGQHSLPAPPPPVPIITVTPNSPTIPDTTPVGATVATYTVTMSDGSTFTGTIGFGPPNFDDGGVFALTGSNVAGNIIVSPAGPGVGPNTGNIVDHITLVANTAPPPPPPSVITSRTFTNTSNSVAASAGTAFRFGLGLKLGDVPSGSSISLTDGAGNVLTAQFDALNFWPDGSVRFCEALGYTARSIAANGSDTITINRVPTAFSNTLPGGLTPAQLLTNLQSFGGAQDLNIQLSSMASCTLANNTYSTGTWTAHFNTLAAGSFVQQTNKGSCCMGFRAWGQPNDGNGHNHAHIHTAFYVWLWLNPATGAIKDVQYIVGLFNSLFTQSTDGTQYSTFPPDRYTYNPALRNGTTNIVTNSDPTMFVSRGLTTTLKNFTPTGSTSIVVSNIGTIDNTWGGINLPLVRIADNGGGSGLPGGVQYTVTNVAPGTFPQATLTISTGLTVGNNPPNDANAGNIVGFGGGHGTRTTWFTARADGKPRWINGTIDAPALLITCDPVQANPQTVHTSRDYLASTYLMPHYDVSVNATDPSTGATTPITWYPGIKGLFNDEALTDWRVSTGLDAGGTHGHIGVLPNWCVRDYNLQTFTTAQNHRVTALGWASLCGLMMDVNGRIPNLRNISYTGMTAPQPTTWWIGDGNGNNAYVNVTESTEGTWSPEGHFPGNGWPYAEWGFCGGGDTTHFPLGSYYTYLMEGGAHIRDILLMETNAVELCNGPDPALGAPFSCTFVDRTPQISTTRYYGNVLMQQSCRGQAWALRTLAMSPAVLPATLADGTAFGEAQYIKDLYRDNMLFAQEWRNSIASVNELNNGFWHFDGSASGTGAIKTATTGTDDPWQQSYLAEAVARGSLLHGGEAGWGSAAVGFATFHAKYFTGLVNVSGRYAAGAQSINLKNGWQFTSPYKADFSTVGIQITEITTPGGDVWTFASFLDTTTGWITIHAAHDNTGTLPVDYVGFGVGARVYFSQDYFADPETGAFALPPAPFVADTGIYFIVATDVPGGRIKVSATSGGSPIIASTTVTNSVILVVSVPIVPTNPPFNGFGGPDSNPSDIWRAVRSYRTAVDNSALQAADATMASGIAIAGNGGAPLSYSTWPMGKVLV